MNPQARQSPARRAFTLAELLVVIAIIGIIIALVLPALGGARNAARKSGTEGQLKTITNAVSSFYNDEHKLPGLFTPAAMGNATNATQGMSDSENVMLALMGYQPGTTGNTINVGPDPANTIAIDSTTIGVPSGGKQYYAPDKKLYTIQAAGSQQMAAAPHADVESNPKQLPDVVDYWGSPLLIWRQDETYITKPGSTNYTFAAANSGTRAKFYWTSNSCFLTATQLGKKGVDQTDPNKGSLLGVNNPTAIASLVGALGNPSDPYRVPGNLSAIPTIPRSARAPFIVQSAGADGVYFGRKDRGAKQFGPPLPTPTDAIQYQVNFAAANGTGYTDTNNKPVSHDVLSPFDDLTSTAGN